MIVKKVFFTCYGVKFHQEFHFKERSNEAISAINPQYLIANGDFFAARAARSNILFF